MKVSVIVPNYNHAPFLEERLNSIMDQTYPDIEVILLDDASNDSSQKIIDEYKNHPKVSIVNYNTENSGSPFQQWKKGFNLASGELIWIAESDDTADNTFLEKLVPYFDQPEVVVAFSDCRIIDNKGNPLHYKNPWVHEEDEGQMNCSFSMEGRHFLETHQRYRNYISNASCAIFRKSAFEKITDEYVQFRYTGDWLFWNELLAHGTVCFTSETLCDWRDHKDTTRSITNFEKDHARLRETIQVINRTNGVLNQPIKKEKYQWILDWWVRRMSFKLLLKYNYLFPGFPEYLKKSYRLAFIRRIKLMLG